MASHSNDIKNCIQGMKDVGYLMKINKHKLINKVKSINDGKVIGRVLTNRVPTSRYKPI